MDMNVVFYPAICIAIHEQATLDSKKIAIQTEAWALVSKLNSQASAFDEALRRTIACLTQQYWPNQDNDTVSWVWIRERGKELLAKAGDVNFACVMAAEAAGITHD